MARNITVTLADGSKHVYANAPDDITPEAVMARAQKDFAGIRVTGLDGGRTPSAAPAAAPAAPAPSPNPPMDTWTTKVGKRTVRFQAPTGATKDEIRAAAREAGVSDANVRGLNFNEAATSRKPLTRDEQLTAAGRAIGDSTTGAPDVATSFAASVRRNLFGIPERLAAAGERWLPSAITGNTSNASYDDILKVIRAKTDAEMGRSTTGNVLGTIVGGVAGGRAAGGIVGGTASKIAASSSPWLARAGNFLENAMTMQKGQKIANAARVVAAGAAGGATQAAGEGSNVGRGVAYGAGSAAALGTGFKGAQVLTRPFRDFMRLSTAGQLLSRLTSATTGQLAARADAYRNATGAEPTLFELLPLADRNKILKQAVVGRDSVVERASGAIRARANNLGPEMSARAREVLQPQRDFIEGGLRRDLTAARGGTPHPDDEALIARAMDSPTDMEQLRDTEYKAIMAPHASTPVAQTFDEILPQVPHNNNNGSITMQDGDPAVTAAIRSAVPGGFRQPNQGVSAGDISDMITTLRGDLGKGGIEGRTAQRAIEHLEAELGTRAPDAAVAHAQATDAYAARSRMMEGIKEGDATRLRNQVQVETNGKLARKVRNAYDSPEGAAGRALGQSNRVLTGLEGSPEEALRSTVGMSRNSVGRQLGQNLGDDPAGNIVAAARAQDESAQALAAASNKAQGGSGDSADAETLVQAIVGLHPSSFMTTKAGAVRKLLDMTYIPENRARTMVDMIFSQDPAMVRRAINAVGNSPNGGQFLQYLGGAAGVGGGSTGQAGGTLPTDVPDEPPPPAPDASAAPPAEAAPAADAAPPAAPADAPQPVDPTSSPYAANLQQLTETENPALLALIDKQFNQESGNHQFDAQGKPIVSKKGAVGIAQVMPHTAPEAAQHAGLPWDEKAYQADPVYNKLLGIGYMSHLLRKYNGSVAHALAAYNAGPTRVDHARGVGDNWLGHLPSETQDYVQRIM